MAKPGGRIGLANWTPGGFIGRLFDLYRSAEHWIEVFRTFYGPTHKAFGALDAAGQQALHAALVDLLGRSSRGDGSGLRVPSEYLEVVVTR